MRCEKDAIGSAGLDVLEEEPPRGGNVLLELHLPNATVTPGMAFASRRSLEILASSR
jgi:glycerate dehydrogenase